MSGLLGGAGANTGLIGDTEINHPGRVLQMQPFSISNSVTGPTATGPSNKVTLIDSGSFKSRGKDSLWHIYVHNAGGTGSTNTSWNAGFQLQTNGGGWSSLRTTYNSLGIGAGDELVYAYYTYSDPRQNKQFAGLYKETIAKGDTVQWRAAVWSTHTGHIDWHGIKSMNIIEIAV